MAEVYALPSGKGLDSLTQIKNILLNDHKDSLIILIDRYVKKLKEFGFSINQNFKRNALKKLSKELYELRVDCVRLMLYFDGNDFFVILHGFVKKQQKTPQSEINKALKEIKKWKELLKKA